MPMKDLFLDYLKLERNYSPATVKHYRDDLKEFERFFQGLDQQLSWESVDSDIVRRWMEYMMDKGNGTYQIKLDEEEKFTGWRNERIKVILSLCSPT